MAGTPQPCFSCRHDSHEHHLIFGLVSRIVLSGIDNIRFDHYYHLSFIAAMMLTQSAALAPILAIFFTLSAASTLTPPVLPLVVRSPYLSTWLGNARAGMIYTVCIRGQRTEQLS